MADFTDKLGRKWQLELNVAAMRRAKKQDINLSQPIEQLQEFVMDDVFLCDALYAVVKPDCDAKGISQDQFDSGFDGKTTEAAREALWATLEEYYDPGKAEMLRTALQSVREEMRKALEELTTSNGSGDAKGSSEET